MRFVGGLVFLGLLSCPLFAQFSGRVTGSVVDSSGASVPNAEVDLYLTGGKKPMYSTRTSTEGEYHFSGVRPAEYDVTVEAKGFLKTTLRGLTVDAARESSVPQIKLQVASMSDTISVTGDVQGVDLNNAEITDTVTVDQINNLPIFDRDPMGLLQLEPGVSNGGSSTVINGMPTSYSDVTLDGINIQDNYIRDNALDYTPNKLLLGQVEEVTIVSSNENSAASGGATETAFSTPSGTNGFHGDALWYNRNNAFSANSWFSNQNGVALPFLNQQQLGATLGGPIQKDKLFFYLNYEAVRTHQQAPSDNTILTANAAQGIFKYKDSTGTLQKVNLLTLKGIPSIDPGIQKLMAQIPGPSQINNALVGDGLNTGGYLFNMRDNGTRDNVTGKLDYNINTRHSVSGSYLWNRYNTDRPDNENDYSVIPKATNPTHTNFLALSWRATPTSRLTNEVRGGFNLAYGYLFDNQAYNGGIVTGLAFSDPVNEYQPQGRTTNTYTLKDDATWEHGRHKIQFGFHMQDVRVHSYSAGGVIPTYNLFMGSGEPQYTLKPSDLPGITENDLANANTLLATLGGFIDGESQSFNVTSRTSGYVPGAPFVRNFLLDDYAVYGLDTWKVSSRLTAVLGLRYEMPGVADERDSLELLPNMSAGAAATLLSNATLNFAGGSVGRPWYKRDWKAFAPGAGFDWDVFGNGKTAVRGGYAITYVNDAEIIAAENMLEGNAGLQGLTNIIGLKNRLANGLPAVPVPVYLVPTTTSQNYASNPFNVLTSIDPNLHRPYVQQYALGIEREILHAVFQVRYVGNHGVGEYRAFDYNQVQIRNNGFLADFLRAQSNGFLSQALGRSFNPAFNPLIPGSQQLTVLNKFSNRGDFTDPNVQNLIETGQPGELATYYQTYGLNPTNAVPIFQNPYALGADMLTNYSSSSYNSLQLLVRHRLHSGLSFEANYTFSKVLSDGDGNLQTRFQAFLDLNNPKLERSRATFDLTHMIKADGSYQLPLGEGHRLSFHPIDRVIGGWIFGGVMVWQSGAPFSILSGYGTLNRAARSYYNGANTTLNGAALKNIVHFQMTGNGPVEIAPSAINPADGSGVNAPGTPTFAGQVFSNPTAGALGALQRRMFSGPWTFDINMSLSKTVKITEHQNLEVRMDAFNALNHATFAVGDQNINSISPGFGAITSMFYGPRVLQFGARYKF